MNNEIKEILEFKENADYKKLSCDEIAILKDYITNLQQENERLKNIINELEKWLNIQITCSSTQDYGVYKMCLNKLKELRSEDK